MKAPTYRQRLLVLFALCLAGAFGLAVRAFSLQVAERDVWAARARAQAAGWQPVYAPRGRILDADGMPLAHGSAAFDLVVRAAPWKAERHVCRHCSFVRYFKPDDPRVPCPRCRRTAWRFGDRRELAELARLLSLSPGELRRRVEAEVQEAEDDLARQLEGLEEARRARRRRMAWADLGWRPRTVLRDIPYEAARAVALHPERYPAFRVDTVQSRRYPGGRAFVHVLGRVKRDRIRAQDPEGGTRYIDVERGVRGLERAFDAELSSVTGWVRFLRHPHGGRRETETAARAVRGLDVRLTMRAADQRRAVQALHRAEGALVVLNARTGAVLALASSPVYDPDDYVRTLQAWRGREGPSPLLDRGARSSFIPGSIMKPFTGLGLLEAGVAKPDTTVHCDRLFRTREGRVLRKALKCAGRHGSVALHRALVKSCNIYFETGVDRLLPTGRFGDYYGAIRSFGFGQDTGVETTGAKGNFSFHTGTGWYEYVASAIGQGRLLVTPVQVARAYAGLATGALPEVHLVAAAGPRSTVVRRTPVDVSPAHLAAVRAALREVPVHGTAHDLGLARFDLSCKTGTAQVRAGVRDPRYNSWLAGYAPARAGRPPISFALVVLNARRGAREECGPRLVEFLDAFYAESGESAE